MKNRDKNNSKTMPTKQKQLEELVANRNSTIEQGLANFFSKGPDSI